MSDITGSGSKSSHPGMSRCAMLIMRLAVDGCRATCG